MQALTHTSLMSMHSQGTHGSVHFEMFCLPNLLQTRWLVLSFRLHDLVGSIRDHWNAGTLATDWSLHLLTIHPYLLHQHHTVSYMVKANKGLQSVKYMSHFQLHSPASRQFPRVYTAYPISSSESQTHRHQYQILLKVTESFSHG